jgi:hypothetical protein
MRSVRDVNKAVRRQRRLPLVPHPDALTCRLLEAEAMSGIRRTMFYHLERRGELELIRIKPPGTRRGITLVRLEDLRSLIDRHRAMPETVRFPAAGALPAEASNTLDEKISGPTELGRSPSKEVPQ